MIQIRADVIEDIVRKIERLERWRAEVMAAEYTQYKGTSSSDFTTAVLTDHGDYGFQTTANQVQMNCNGSIRKIATTA